MSISADNKAIKIPSSHYVGFNKRGEEEIPLGFATPDGTDSAATKRKQTVDDWASRSEIKIAAQSFDNIALSGFKLSRSIKRGSSWGQGNVKWRIEDPRGFELEISSLNFSQIVTCSTLERGEILDQCVWGRLGADNILIPVSSDVYKAATSNTERAGKKASMRDLKLGDRIVLQNGSAGRFLGNMMVVSRANNSFSIVHSKQRFIFAPLDEQGKITQISAIGSPKLSEIHKDVRLTPEQCEQIANDAVLAGAEIDATGSYSTRDAAVVLEPINKFIYDFEPFNSFEDAKQAVNTRFYRSIIAKSGSKWGIVDPYEFERTQKIQLKLIDADTYLGQMGLNHVMERRTGTNWGFGGYGYDVNATYTVPANDPVEWYLARASYTTAAGYQGKIYY